MKLISAVCLVVLCAFSNGKNAPDVLKQMYKRYDGKWQANFTFNQTTENYRHDSLIRTSTWYEAIVYPDKFRIDFGDRKEGNAVIYNKDSAYNFRKGKLVRTSVNDDDLTFLLGGMYFYPLDTVEAKMNRFGYSLDKFHEDKWNDRPVYVIGANSTAEKTDQVWIDKENLVVVRFIKYTGGRKEEGVLSDHKRFGDGWSETACSFYFDDKLFQKETYHDCKANTDIDLSMFDPKKFSIPAAQ